jgi:hypothetical protein
MQAKKGKCQKYKHPLEMTANRFFQISMKKFKLRRTLSKEEDRDVVNLNAPVTMLHAYFNEGK